MSFFDFVDQLPAQLGCREVGAGLGSCSLGVSMDPQIPHDRIPSVPVRCLIRTVRSIFTFPQATMSYLEDLAAHRADLKRKVCVDVACRNNSPPGFASAVSLREWVERPSGAPKIAGFAAMPQQEQSHARASRETLRGTENGWPCGRARTGNNCMRAKLARSPPGHAILESRTG